MPIYAYRCNACGHARDVLQKMSDAVLTVCPACGEASFAKQLTAAGFQLKGSGWYATDFRGGNAPAAKDKGAEGEGQAAGKTDAPTDTRSDKAAESTAGQAAKPSEASAAKSGAKPAGAAAPAAAPAASSGPSK